MVQLHKSEKGFTLIEILVVVAIIGLLSSIVMAALSTARVKARDSRRLSDILQIKKALELYYLNNNTYPSILAEGEAGCAGWDSSAVDNDGNGRFFIEPLETSGMIVKMPKDPLNSPSCAGYTYRYYLYTGGNSGCTKTFYVLGIYDLEGTNGGNHASSPGWNCPSRNWSLEFEWVTGAYE